MGISKETQLEHYQYSVMEVKNDQKETTLS